MKPPAATPTEPETPSKTINATGNANTRRRYLNTVEEGGETNFPMADNDKPVRTMKKCEQGLMVKAVRGSAVLW